ncbi:hypothetical protein [Trueperella sp. LYQ143]|uniref:hypothetical protein n=1 Tax=unclassified Trueperella TaxID=2630174 RepID=UPI00398343FD
MNTQDGPFRSKESEPFSTWSTPQTSQTPQFVLKPNFTPYLTILVLAALVIGVPTVGIIKGTWKNVFHDFLPITITILLLLLGLAALIATVIEVRNERVFFYADEFVYVSGWRKKEERVRYDEIEQLSYDSGWSRGEVHITVHTADGRQVKISNRIFNHHRFGREVKKHIAAVFNAHHNPQGPLTGTDHS